MKKFTLLFCLAFFYSLNSYSAINVSKEESFRIWNQLLLIGKIENVNMVKIKDNKESIVLETLACSYEMYDACSFFINTEKGRQLIIAVEGTSDLMDSFARAGVEIDVDYSQMNVGNLSCFKHNTDISCIIDN